MKITIEDGTNKVILESADTIESAKTRKLLDVLFSVEPKRVSWPRKVVTSVVDRPEILSLYLDPNEFGQWLNDRSPTETVQMISSFVGADVTEYSNVHSLIMSVPQFAYKLGYNRFMIATEWLKDQGWLGHMPQSSSMRTYYSKSLRIQALNT